ncbi:MAG: phosphoenolpyruvate--protein phosphotransferase, partial [Propionibacteriales bacterium]|nr:phosphoenolpyruvate--protein phosphotransferase [Propionibacteriales bacterium]
MIGLVVVSHSRALAEAAVGLASEMVDTADLPPIAVAAGLDEATFGTDAAAVAEAIGKVDNPDGVLVLLDLGSAVLSAEMALEFLDPDQAGRVVVSSAPLVEGLVAAVVLASTGASMDAVVEEAMRGLEGKQDHLGDVVSAPPTEGEQWGRSPADRAIEGEAQAPSRSVDIEVTNAHGLHARPAARLVSLVRSFDATVRLTNIRTGRGPVDAASLSRVATLDARQSDRLRVAASGPDAEAALAAVRDLAARAFDDEDAPAPALGEPGRPAQTGTGLDIAIGPAVVPMLDIDTGGYVAGGVDDELARSRSAVAAASAAIAAIRDRTRTSIGQVEADIFDAQLALLSDPSLGESAEQAIQGGLPAPVAWSDCLEALAAEFEELDDAYQRERAQDVRSIRRRILAALTGLADADPSDSVEAGILVLPELDAATAATLDTGRIVGIATRHGGATGHGVIVARSRGVPIITDVADAAGVRPSELVAFDARSREFVVDPDEVVQARFRTEITARMDRRAGALSHAGEPAMTRDGCRVMVAANVTSVDDALVAGRLGAEGSGLVRTEVLFAADRTRPTVDRQVETFLAVAGALSGQPITIRTWDVGGDKPLRFLPQPVEANPFLGERGLRLFRRQPEVLREQLQAVCLAARETPTRVMFPMVTTVEEVGWALGQLRTAAAAVTGEIPPGLEVGIMIEVPAAALRAGRLARELDFVSIGTNDLTQYTAAADRGNAAVARLADGLEPAVLQLIQAVCADVPERVVVAVCGDLASNESVAPLLVGLGARELSVV